MAKSDSPLTLEQRVIVGMAIDDYLEIMIESACVSTRKGRRMIRRCIKICEILGIATSDVLPEDYETRSYR